MSLALIMSLPTAVMGKDYTLRHFFFLRNKALTHFLSVTQLILKSPSSDAFYQTGMLLWGDVKGSQS